MAQSTSFRATRAGAALVCGWLALAGAAVLFFLLPLPVGTRMLAALFWCVLCFGLLAPRLASCRVRVGGNHLTVRVGALFLPTKRIPLRFITGCRILQTPLGRMGGVCLLVLFGAGTWTLIPGVRAADAEALAARLSHGGKLL